MQEVKDHISTFPAVESHYCRASTCRKYLDPTLNVTKMYEDYCTKHKEKGQEPLGKSSYKCIFKRDFKLAFHKPKKDACKTCNINELQSLQSTRPRQKGPGRQSEKTKSMHFKITASTSTRSTCRVCYTRLVQL